MYFIYEPRIVQKIVSGVFNMATTCKKSNAKLNLLKDIDEMLMEGWADDLSIGEVLDRLPISLRNAFLNLRFTAPTKTDDGLNISFKI